MLFAKCHTIQTIFVTGVIHLRFLDRTTIADQSIIHLSIHSSSTIITPVIINIIIADESYFLTFCSLCVLRVCLCVLCTLNIVVWVCKFCVCVFVCVYYFYTFTFIFGLVYLLRCTLNLVHDACRARVERAKSRALYKMDYGLWTLGVTKQFRKTERTYADEHAR